MTKMTIRAFGAAAVVAVSAAFTLGASTSAQANEQYCDEQAHEYASQHTRGRGTVGGALVGGTVGAVIGKIVGGNTGAGVGALVGGSTGAIVGTDREQRRYEALYYEAYENCVEEVSYRQDRRRNTGPARVQAGTYEPWSEEWYDYCEAKYRSFNPQTGEFLSYSGEYKMCR
jgi:uncharacterized protein YcfJ